MGYNSQSTEKKPPTPAVYRMVSGQPLGGRVRVPGSKSMTQRYFNLALVGARPLTVRHPLRSEDPELFLGALAAAGFGVEHRAEEVALTPGERPAAGEIFCGNGGTMFRFLTAALTTVPGTWRLDGVPRLGERPVGPLVTALRQLGAAIDCPRAEGFAPLTVRGGTLTGGRATLDAGASSQYLSALLMAALAARQPVTVEVAALASEPYVDLTLDAVAELGGRVTREGGGYRVEPGLSGAATTVTVEGDFSAAAYPAAAAALAGGEVEITGLRAASRQGDRGFIDLLARMGAPVAWRGDALVVGRGELTAVTADLSSMPDQVPTLAAVAPFARGTTRIEKVAQLRIKESDRLRAMARELGRLGVPVEELEDGLVIPGVWADAAPPSAPVEVDTWNDHRIAMSLALVGLRRPGVVIRNPGVVVKSYPDFWRDLERLQSSPLDPPKGTPQTSPPAPQGAP